MTTEQNILRFSAFLELCFGIGGILVAWYSGSKAVWLDGGYSLLGSMTMLINVRIARMVKQPVSPQRPYGSAALEPLTLVFEALILIALCATLLIIAIYQLCHGGNMPAFGLTLGYATISTLVGGAVSISLLHLHRSITSPLIYFEYQEWLLDASISAVSMMAFSLAFIIGDYHPVTPYIDSFLTLLLLLCLVRLPIKALSKNIRQLLLQDIPEPKLTHSLKQALAPEASTMGTHILQVRMLWMGRWLLVDIEITASQTNTALLITDIQKLQSIAETTVKSMTDYHRIQICIPAKNAANR